MAHYRIHKLDRADRILVAVDAECTDDRSAFTWAGTTFGGNGPVEIWNGSRYVGRTSATALGMTAEADRALESDWS